MRLFKSPYNFDPNLGKLLQDRERMLSTLMSNLNGMVYCCLVDEHWTMVFVSEGCQKLTGYVVDDLLLNDKITYESLTFEEDRRWVREKINAAVKAGVSFDLEYRILHADGDVRWVHEIGGPLYNEQGHFVALEGFIQDLKFLRNSERIY
jgi:PAS domain S-box-containing protein